MKVLSVLLLSFVLVSPYAKADNSDDRIDIGGVYRIKHSKNFEYVCHITIHENGDSYKSAIWIDDNFNKKDISKAPSLENMRLALSWPELETVMNSIGFEFKLTSLSLGRCKNTCYIMNAVAEGRKGEEKFIFTFTQNEKNPAKYDFKYESLNEGITESYVQACEANKIF